MPVCPLNRSRPSWSALKSQLYSFGGCAGAPLPCGLLSAGAEQRLLSRRGLLLWSTGSGSAGFGSGGSQALENRLSGCGTQASVAPKRARSSRKRDQTHVSCLGRRILHH